MTGRRKALLSVTDKSGLGEFASALQAAGYELVASGGTFDFLKRQGMEVTRVSEITGFPEILGGRVKTLHPAIHGGILARRNLEQDIVDLEANRIVPIDIVVANLYRFEATVAGSHTLDDAMEAVDIGGVALIRAAAKNFEHVAVVTDPQDYPALIAEIRPAGQLSRETRLRLARKAFACSARYDASISNYMNSLGSEGSRATAFPDVLSLQFSKLLDLRYGENPHQKAALYRDAGEVPVSIAGAGLLGGKELSFTNVLDLDAAWRLVTQFPQAAAAVIKHTNPCGLAVGEDSLADIYVKARECDPLSAFGGIVGLNREVDQETASQITATFIECVIAPAYSGAALEILRTKANMRIVLAAATAGCPGPAFPFDVKRVSGGILVQEFDSVGGEVGGAKVVTRRPPSESELRALDLAWKVCAAVKSNAIVFAREDRIVGVGAGQMSRIDSVKIAAAKAGSQARGAVMASDAFFPFRDGIDEAARAGVSAVVQPGGSRRDEEVTRAADEHGMAMLFAGFRHFRH